MERFEEIYRDFEQEVLSCDDAARILGCSVRHFHRLRGRYESAGLIGLKDGRMGRVSCHRAADSEIEALTRLYREKYQGFNVRHFHEFARCRHGLRHGYTWTRTVLRGAGLVSSCGRGGPHRLRRPRRPMRGMMLHQDASQHQWFGTDYHDLVVTLDDATSEITSAFFCLEEGTQSSFRGILETIEKEGVFCSLYTDRGSHYFHTPEAGGKVDKNRPTQVGRALKQLGIEHIAAYSPQARGRSERMFGTLQGRLPQELALEGIYDLENANSYLKEIYLPMHNTRFTSKPECAQSAFTPLAGFDLANILCIREDRVVACDNTVHYQGKKLQIPQNPLRHHFVKTQVRVHHYQDDTLALFYGPREIGRYDAQGKLQENTQRR